MRAKWGGNMHAWIRIAAALAGVWLCHGEAVAQEPFFKGKTVTIYVGGTAGGGVDTSARLLSRYLGKHLPGNPAMSVQLMPGAGGIRAVDYLFTTAPRDGTVMTALPAGPLLEPLIGGRKMSYAITDFTAVGAMTKDVSVCVAWGASGFKTIDDARAKEMNVAGTGAGSTPDQYPIVLNETLSTKFKVITGYMGTQETVLAIERGEADGRCGWGWASLKATKPDWLREHKINLLAQMGLSRNRELADVPLVLDLAKNDADRQMLRLLFAPLDVNRPVLAPPGLPPERAKEIRAAFMAAMNDAEFKAEVKALTGEESDPTSGEEMQKLLGEIYATPTATVERLKAVLAKS
jgi:tripartite-type tricarboxylate transporter receptor subunit TctC